MDWIINLLKIIWANLSPKLREMLVELVNEWEKEAKESANPWDDLAVAILKVILGIS